MRLALGEEKKNQNTTKENGDDVMKWVTQSGMGSVRQSNEQIQNGETGEQRQEWDK